ncbi:MAG: glutamate--tRNA ligase, partial [Candidatus Nanohaloarchaea archaeon]|nr:glutamate--tRNA ligase [Candidatus Nanohaloarchaea archaeon]
MDLEELLKKYAARNALDHGSAEVDAVVGKVFAEQPELKERADEVVAEAEEIIDEVNQMPEEALTSIIEGHEYEEKEEEGGLPELPSAEDTDVVMRMAPFP